MRHINLLNYVDSSLKYVEDNWVKSKPTNFVKKQVGARFVFLGLASASVIASAIDTIVGVGFGVASAFNRGNNDKINYFTKNHLSSSRGIICMPYGIILNSFFLQDNFSGDDRLISYKGNGFISGFVINYLEEKAQTSYKSKNFLQRHVVTRLTYALMAVSLLVSRAVDGVIGLVAFPSSILTGGYFKPLNNLAFRALQFPGIIDDLFMCFIRSLNPEANIELGTKPED